MFKAREVLTPWILTINQGENLVKSRASIDLNAHGVYNGTIENSNKLTVCK